jgi:RimJ/RimL family protein N-acetyltransferase
MKINIHELKDRELKYVVIVAKYQNKLIMVRHRDRTTYEIPGGHIEALELPDEAAKRELFEETGAVAYEIEAIGDYSVGESYGRLYTANITKLGKLPESEIAEVTNLNDNMTWTYDKIQPYLIQFAECYNSIRVLSTDDSANFINLLETLDYETTFMMFEPGERKSTVEDTKNRIEQILSSGMCFVDDNLNGFILLSRGQCNRVSHVGYLVMGIKQAASGKKLGTLLFNKMIKWATENNLHRLELTVMVQNESGVNLYKKMGFDIEGIKKDSMCIDGVYVDEYYMSKLLEV